MSRYVANALHGFPWAGFAIAVLFILLTALCVVASLENLARFEASQQEIQIPD